MATTNLGRIAIVNKGAYVAGTYKRLDVVTYLGKVYICNALTSTALPTVAEDWSLMVEPPALANHAGSHISGGADIIPVAVGGGNAGLMSGADKTKLDGAAPLANPTFSGLAVFDQIIVIGSINSAATNNIGIPGTRGFGVGTCPTPPAGMAPMLGCFDTASDNYGNYQYADGSIMVWIPAFYYKYGTGANGVTLNNVNIKPLSDYADVATATAAGYALHRMFYDGGVVKTGVFVDKYICSNNNGIASSIRNRNPLSTAADHNPIAALTGAPANFYYGAIAATKTRGASFFCNSRFIVSGLALLALAHAQASSSVTYCGWYNATYNFPKGCNNNALGDTNDVALAFASDGYENCSKTGSANYFNRTTHNGQNCGIADLNGCMWEVTPGLATDDAGTTYYVLKTATAMKNVTGGTGGATDLWGAAGLAALYDSLGATYGAATASSTNKPYGSAAQVLSEATSGLPWQAAGLGIPLVGGTGGTNLFGSDYFLNYRPAAMCPLSGGAWSNGSDAGVWAFNLNAVRGGSYAYVGFRSALYL